MVSPGTSHLGRTRIVGKSSTCLQEWANALYPPSEDFTTLRHSDTRGRAKPWSSKCSMLLLLLLHTETWRSRLSDCQDLMGRHGSSGTPDLIELVQYLEWELLFKYNAPLVSSLSAQSYRIVTAKWTWSVCWTKKGRVGMSAAVMVRASTLSLYLTPVSNPRSCLSLQWVELAWAKVC